MLLWSDIQKAADPVNKAWREREKVQDGYNIERKRAYQEKRFKHNMKLSIKRMGEMLVNNMQFIYGGNRG